MKYNTKKKLHKQKQKRRIIQESGRYEHTRDEILENGIVHCPAFTAPLIDFGFDHNDSD